MGVDWSKRHGYIASRSVRRPGDTDIDPQWANEALTDPHRRLFDPDYASQSGQSLRTIGWSQTAGMLLTVITVRYAGRIYGANAWRAGRTDQRHYQEGLDDDQRK